MCAPKLTRFSLNLLKALYVVHEHENSMRSPWGYAGSLSSRQLLANILDQELCWLFWAPKQNRFETDTIETISMQMMVFVRPFCIHFSTAESWKIITYYDQRAADLSHRSRNIYFCVIRFSVSAARRYSTDIDNHSFRPLTLRVTCAHA